MATFLALAQDAVDMTFGLTDQPQLFQTFGLTKDTVVLFKKVGQGWGKGEVRGQVQGSGSADPHTVVQFDEGRADFPVDEELGLDQEELSRFLLTHSMHLVTEFNSQVSWATGTGADCRRGSQR